MSDGRTSKITLVVTVERVEGPDLGWLCGEALSEMIRTDPGTFYVSGGCAEYRVKEVTVEDVEV